VADEAHAAGIALEFGEIEALGDGKAVAKGKPGLGRVVHCIHLNRTPGLLRSSAKTARDQAGARFRIKSLISGT
jgi:hypothetical protein